MDLPNGLWYSNNYISTYLIQAVKKVCDPQEGHCEKGCEIQGGGQEWL